MNLGTIIQMAGTPAIGCSVLLGVTGQFLQPAKHINYLLWVIYCLLALTNGHCGQLADDGNNLAALLGIHAGWHGGSDTVEDGNRSVKCGKPITRTLAATHLCPQMHDNLSETTSPLRAVGVSLLRFGNRCGVLVSADSGEIPSAGDDQPDKQRPKGVWWHVKHYATCILIWCLILGAGSGFARLVHDVIIVVTPNDPKLSHGHWKVTPKCNRDNQISFIGRN
jgi:hypothetical protein